MTALGHHYSLYYRKILVRLWYMLNRTLKTNIEPRWPLKSNLELSWPPFMCHVIWAVFATRYARTFVRSEDSGPFVRRTSRMKKTSVRENTYVRNGPVEYAQSHGDCIMMTSSNGNIFRVTGHLCGEFTGRRWIPHTKASDAELWCILWSALEWTIE